jgi:hypothetical protein
LDRGRIQKTVSPACRGSWSSKINGVAQLPLTKHTLIRDNCGGDHVVPTDVEQRR